MPETLADQLAAVIDTHMNPLYEKRDQLAEDLLQVQKQIEREEKEIAKQLEKLQNRKATTSKKSTTKKKASSTGKPGAADEQCLKAITQVLNDNGTLSVSETIALAQDKLREEGFEMRGLKQRLEKMLSGDCFEIKGKNISLAKVVV